MKNIIELSSQELRNIEGGEISPKTLRMGMALFTLCPIVGAGYWFGYYMNN